MATYLMTFSYTQQGIQKIKEGPAVSNREEGHSIIGRRGHKAFYGILGAEYDTLFILEAPDAQAVGKMALAIGSQGNVHTSTHRLFSDEEFKKIITGLP